MAEGRQGLELRQTQGLVMTPQLQQAIKLLQLSHQELNTLIETEMAANPLLEMDDSAPKEAALEGDNDFPDLDSGEGDYWDGSSDAAPAERDHYAAPEDDYDRMSSASEIKTLADHISQQAALMFHEPGERLLAAQLIDALEPSGYFTADLTDFADRLGADLNAVEAILLRLQQCDPAGVFARNLAECLTLQLKDQNRLDPWMETLLQNLDLVAKRDTAKLAKLAGCDVAAVQEMLAEIRRLNPKPGAGFDAPVAETMVPDVFVKKDSDGVWYAELNPASQPAIVLNSGFYEKAAKLMPDKEQKQFLTRAHHSGSFLLKALAQRAETIYRVTGAIVRQQQEFFDKGMSYLKPMVLRDIAVELEVHESTVSRITTAKFLSSPRGVFELKYFFAAGLKNVVGQEGAFSARSVQHRIKTLIDGENPKTVLSDDALVTLLQKEGIEVARRTVAKYREGMGIPSSMQRRRLKRA
ncbi:MAG: RNA polymerase factor sigma-54 [Alphaproteobacteria bacterium]|jgi:RNA polymerase sigma-54 factor|nr:RNA polymerase factor sigma-54 [Alphaproteobacteria bacterium]